MADAGIVRNRAKIEATIDNARAVPDSATSISTTCCGRSRRRRARGRPTMADVPAVTPESTAMAKELKRRGFKFVGPTTAYALMQATGMVDDHLAACWVPIPHRLNSRWTLPIRDSGSRYSCPPRGKNGSLSFKPRRVLAGCQNLSEGPAKQAAQIWREQRMAAMKPRTGHGPLEATKEGRGIVMRVPLEGGGRLVVELTPEEAAALGEELKGVTS